MYLKVFKKNGRIMKKVVTFEKLPAEVKEFFNSKNCYNIFYHAINGKVFYHKI